MRWGGMRCASISRGRIQLKVEEVLLYPKTGTKSENQGSDPAYMPARASQRQTLQIRLASFAGVREKPLLSPNSISIPLNTQKINAPRPAPVQVHPQGNE